MSYLVTVAIILTCLQLRPVVAEQSVGDPTFEKGTAPPTDWQWTVCLGMYPQGSLNVVGTWERFVVLTETTNRTFVVDLQNHTVVKSETLQPNPAGQVTYSLLNNGMLLQLNYATITAFSVPQLDMVWSVNTFPIGYESPVILSSTRSFFCLFIAPGSTTWLTYPACFRVSDGFLFWTGIGYNNVSSAGWTILAESDGILVAGISPLNSNGYESTAVHVDTGTILWTVDELVVASAEELVLFQSSTNPENGNGTWAINIRTRATVWSQPELELQAPVIIAGGLIISPSGANYISNGSSAWSIPANIACSAGILVSSPESPSKGSDKPKFLCSTNFDAGLNYTVGDLRTGRIEKQALFYTPGGNSLFATQHDGFFFFAAHVIDPAGLARYCLHGLPLS